MMGANEIPELFKEVELYHLTNQTVCAKQVCDDFNRVKDAFERVLFCSKLDEQSLDYGLTLENECINFKALNKHCV